jgi:hypothetical protein
MRRVSWTRGFFRLWLVATVLWVLGLAAMVRLDRDLASLYALRGAAPVADTRDPGLRVDDALRRFDLAMAGNRKSDQELVASTDVGDRIAAYERRLYLQRRLHHFLYPAVGLPLGAFVLGATLAWVLRGFRPN